MAKPRFGLKFNIGKHGRLYVPLGSSAAKKKADSKNRSPAPSSNRSSNQSYYYRDFDKKPSRASGIFTIVGGSVLSLFWGLAAYLLFYAVLGFIRHKIFNAVILLFLALFPIGIGIAGVKLILQGSKSLKVETQEDRDHQEASALSQQGLGKSASFSFPLELDSDPAFQSILHDLKIRITAEGLRGKAFLTDNDDGLGFGVYLDEQFLGRPIPEAAAWIDENADRIKGITSIAIYGGAVDVEGQPRPFIPMVTIGLSDTIAHPISQKPVLKPAATFARCNVDAVCYVSSTKKIHLGGFSCGVSLYACKPMLLQEALDAGCTPCAKCF